MATIIKEETLALILVPRVHGNLGFGPSARYSSQLHMGGTKGGC